MEARCGNWRTRAASRSAGPRSKERRSSAAKAWVQDLVAGTAMRPTAAWGSTSWATSRTCGTTATGTSIRSQVTYDELRDRSVAFATAIKEADPTAKVIGFSEWGWTNYFCSAADETGAGSWGCQRHRRKTGPPTAAWSSRPGTWRR